MSKKWLGLARVSDRIAWAGSLQGRALGGFCAAPEVVATRPRPPVMLRPLPIRSFCYRWCWW